MLNNKKNWLKIPLGVEGLSSGNIDGLKVSINGVLRLKPETTNRRKAKIASKKNN